MRAYQRIKNKGGGFCYEFFNAVTNFIDAIRNKDTENIKKSFNKLDSWELEKHKQVEIMNYALNLSSASISNTKIIKIITRE